MSIDIPPLLKFCLGKFKYKSVALLGASVNSVGGNGFHGDSISSGEFGFGYKAKLLVEFLQKK